MSSLFCNTTEFTSICLPLQDLGPEALAQIKAAQELAKQMSQQAVAVGFRPSMSGMGQMEAPSAVVAAAQAAASQIAQKVASHPFLCVSEARAHADVC